MNEPANYNNIELDELKLIIQRRDYEIAYCLAKIANCTYSTLINTQLSDFETFANMTLKKFLDKTNQSTTTLLSLGINTIFIFALFFIHVKQCYKRRQQRLLEDDL